jgi:hypothetical protein
MRVVASHADAEVNWLERVISSFTEKCINLDESNLTVPGDSWPHDLCTGGHLRHAFENRAATAALDDCFAGRLREKFSRTSY